MKVQVTSAFSLNGAGGNKAGVVFFHPELGREEKMGISRKLGFSETAFVTQGKAADYHLEYFTPVEEVPLCGHATIATFATMKLLGMLDRSRYTIETLAGVLEIRVSEDGLIMMQQNNPEYSELVYPKELQSSIGAAGIQSLAEALPIQVISTGLRDVMLPVQDPEALDQLKVDFPAMSEFSEAHTVVGVHAFTLTEGAVDAVCRNFAPLYGINEESATGTSNCALAGYLFRYVKQKEIYVFEQGYSMGLPSRIIVKLEHTGERIDKVYVGGYGYLVEEREL